MNSKTVWMVAAGLVVAAGVTWVSLRSARKAAPAYRQVALERGNVESTIAATGKLGAVTTVQVGTQASGQVSALYADFNDHVKKGQIIARIDPTLQQQAVREAEAGLQRNQAEYDKADVDHTRSKALNDRDLNSTSDLNASEYALAVALANVKSGQIAREKARRNLSYTAIHAPIDGIVIERNVDMGQTVAASMSAPQLFLIANDLTQMQILASVAESDIGQIHEGMAVRFTVQAEARKMFMGVVRQLRLQSTTTENVVNYTVVISVDNADGQLLPGMTATVAFLTGSATDVFLVPNAALRIRPTQAMLQQTGSRRTAGALRGGRNATPDGSARSRNATSEGLLWYVGADHKLATTRVHVGISDGQKTEVQGTELIAGMQVVIGTSAGGASSTAAASSPFQQRSGSGPPGQRGGFLP
jgi:HlyD family secretion protein